MSAVVAEMAAVALFLAMVGTAQAQPPLPSHFSLGRPGRPDRCSCVLLW